MIVTLVGPMGAGKSTIGRHLAARFAYEFIDLDAVIVERTGKSIPSIFEDYGECMFRALESEVLASIYVEKHDGVLSTGGGAVLLAANRVRMQRAGPVVWLHADPEILAARIIGDTNRPLIKGVDPLLKARELASIRTPMYATVSELKIDTGKISEQEAIDTIGIFLSESSHE